MSLGLRSFVSKSASQSHAKTATVSRCKSVTNRSQIITSGDVVTPNVDLFISHVDCNIRPVAEVAHVRNSSRSDCNPYMTCGSAIIMLRNLRLHGVDECPTTTIFESS